MYKKIYGYLNKKKANLLIVVSSAYLSILPNTMLYVLDREALMFLNFSFISVVANLLLAYSLLGLILLIFSFNKYVLKTVISILIISNAIFFYIFYVFHIDVGLGIILAILNTNFTEIKEQSSLISFSTVIYAILIILIPLIFVWKHQIKKDTQAKTVIVMLIIMIIGISLSFEKMNQNDDARGRRQITKLILPAITFFPNNYLYTIVKSYVMLKGNKFSNSDFLEKNNFQLKKSEPYTVVLVIGESARGANFSLGKYLRETNPLLKRVKNLVYFNDFKACYTSTIPSVSCMLSFMDAKTFNINTEENLYKNVDSFIEVFNKLNFDTYLITTNSYKAQDPSFYRLKSLKNITYMFYSLGYKDGDMNHKLKEILEKKSKKNTLIIIHSMGSHFKYSARYPEEFGEWSPICTSISNRDIQGCPNELLINEYDNSILYTDFVLNSFISTLKNSRALLIYTSDHGESLGELDKNGQPIFLHSMNPSVAPEEQLHVPTFIWFSESWLESFGKNQLVNARKKANRPMGHDYISHSIVDCAFIESKIINKKLSFCANN